MPGYTPDPPTLLIQGHDISDTAQPATYVTASLSPTPNRTVLLAIGIEVEAGTTPPPTVTGCGITWILEAVVIGIETSPDYNSNNNLYLFKGRSPLAVAGALTIAFPTNSAPSAVYQNCVWIAAEFGSIDLNPVQSNVHDAGITVATSETNTLAAFSSTDNATFGILSLMNNANTAITPGSGFTEIAQELGDRPSTGSDLRVQMQSKPTNDTSVDWTFNNPLVVRVLSIACELDWEPFDPTHLRYFGTGHLLYLNALTVPQVSSDYGVTFTGATAPSGGTGGPFIACKAVQADAANERIWSVWTNAAETNAAIAYSTDFGATWTIVDSNASSKITDIACHPADTDRVAAVGSVSTDATVWVTQDRGVTWAERTGPALLNTISYQPIASGSSAYITWTPYGRLLISTGGRLSTADGDLYYSEDLGVNWTKATVPSPAPNRNWNVQIFRVGGFGPYFMLYGDEATGAAASALLRSDDHGVSWHSVLTPTTSENFAGIQYDPLTDTLLLSTPTHVYGLSPSASDDPDDWSDQTANFYTIALTGQYVFQPFAFVSDPAPAA